MKNKKKTKATARNRMFKLLWFLQLIAQCMALGAIWQLNMVPDKYFLILAGAFALLALFTGVLMMPKKAGGVRTGFGLFFSVLVFLISCAASVLVLHAQGTIQGIAGHTGNDLTMAVYVRQDDPAQTLADAADYRFAVVAGYETERTQEAVASIEKELGSELNLTEYDGPLALLAAFFSEEADALILNSAYVNLLEDLDGYEDFYDRIRLLHEVKSNAWSAIVENIGNIEGNGGFFQSQKDDVTQNSFVFYISGSDTRDKKLVTSRSDVNILAVVNPQTKQVLLLNTPRDYFIPNPVSSAGTLDKLTHCGIYGIECSMQALSNLYGVDIDYYAQINFTGFETLIDAIGGVTVYCEKGFTTNRGVNFQTGENTLNGKEALVFARERYHVSGGDNGRGKNQMKVIKAVIDKMTTGTTLLSNYAGIMQSLEGMFATSMASDEIADLVKMQLDDMAQWNIVSYAVTGNNGMEITYSMPGTPLSVMYQDEQLVSYASHLIDRVIAGDILTEADMTAPQ